MPFLVTRIREWSYSTEAVIVSTSDFCSIRRCNFTLFEYISMYLVLTGLRCEVAQNMHVVLGGLLLEGRLFTSRNRLSS